MFNQIKLVAFDLDDTLLAFDLVTDQSWLQACTEYTIKNPSIDCLTLIETIKKAGAVFWKNSEQFGINRYNIYAARRTFLKITFEILEINDMDNAEQLADRYSKLRIENMYLLPGILNTLKQIKLNYKLVLITNRDSSGQWNKIRRFDLEKHFDKIYIEEEMGFGKPDIRVFEKVMKEYCVQPNECLMIDDTPEHDIIPANKLGWKTAFVKTRNINPTFSDYKPDLILEYASQVINHLKIN